MKNLVQLINQAKSIVLTTHRQCDGDGLGAQMALYFALKKTNKQVRLINVDRTPKKYRFLQPDNWIQYYDSNKQLPSDVDLVLIFDTNDERLVEPLFSGLKAYSPKFIFLDHHPVLSHGPKPSTDSLIDISAASTGELAYKLIQELGIELDRNIARAIYTSITFDTQLYRFIRNSPVSHLIAADLLKYDIDPEEVHRHLFAHQTVNKMGFLARALAQIEYFCDGRVALLKLRDADILQFQLEPDESRDVIDMIMAIEDLEAAAMFREDAPNEFKVSLRSKGQVEVLPLAEALGGGGHMFAAGAYYKGDYEKMKAQVVAAFISKMPAPKKTA